MKTYNTRWILLNDLYSFHENSIDSEMDYRKMGERLENLLNDTEWLQVTTIHSIGSYSDYSWNQFFYPWLSPWSWICDSSMLGKSSKKSLPNGGLIMIYHGTKYNITLHKSKRCRQTALSQTSWKLSSSCDGSTICSKALPISNRMAQENQPPQAFKIDARKQTHGHVHPECQVIVNLFQKT